MLNNNCPIPLYSQLKTFIENQIETKTWLPGIKIPSEAELSQQFQVSRTTVRQAIGELVSQGKLVRTQGRGTFVNEFIIDQPIYRLSGFGHNCQAQGLIISSKVLKFEVIPPSIAIRKSLNLGEQELALYLKRIRKINNSIVGIDNSFMPFNRYRALLHEDFENQSLYEVLANKFDTIPQKQVRSTQAVGCSPEESGILEVEPGIPILVIISTSYDQHDQPFEHCESYMIGNRYSFNIEIYDHQ